MRQIITIFGEDLEEFENRYRLICNKQLFQSDLYAVHRSQLWQHKTAVFLIFRQRRSVEGQQLNGLP